MNFGAGAGAGAGDFTGLSEAERWLDISQRLLGGRDLEGSKRFAERAVETDPLVDAAADRLIAAADVLLASQSHRNNHIDWYAVLQLEPSCPPSAVLHQYRRLAIALRPPLDSKDPALDDAFVYAAKLVEGAWTVLSDPQKRALYNAELGIPSSAATVSPPQISPFWAACTSCCHLHQYDRVYEGKKLRCPNCNKGFPATPLPSPPPIVPGTNMYYCSWGFFPLGFADELGTRWKTFYPFDQHVSQATDPKKAPESPFSGSGYAKAPPSVSTKKAVAKKSVGVVPRKVLVSEVSTRSSGHLNAKPTTEIDVNREAGSSRW